jgi:pimeloyl-ACP methyl ester carboxylesterase
VNLFCGHSVKTGIEVGANPSDDTVYQRLLALGFSKLQANFHIPYAGVLTTLFDTSILQRMELNPATNAHADVFHGHDQLRLCVEKFGGAQLSKQPTLIFTHGFGQNRLSWRASARSLSALGFNCLCLDARGHGDSDWSEGGAYELDDFVWDLSKLAQHLTAQTGRKPILIGASMGGLVGMLAECEAPGTFGAIVLVDVTPRWENAGVSRIFEFMRAYPDGFADIHAASAAVSAYMPHRESQDPERLRGHLRAGADSRLRWHWDPSLLEHIPKASERYQARLEAAASAVKCPLLLLSGGKSDVVSSRTIQHFLSLVPHATHQQITDATHLIVGDRNDVFCQAIHAYLTQLFREENYSSHLVQPRNTP